MSQQKKANLEGVVDESGALVDLQLLRARGRKVEGRQIVVQLFQRVN